MDTVTLTRRLVTIPSHEDETTAGEFVEHWLGEHTDASVTRDTHGNVFASVGEGDRTLALAGHHDVVPPDDSQTTGSGEYAIETHDDRLCGRGTADMKGSLAAAMCALRDVDPDALDCQLVFVSFVAEEQGALGSKAAVEDGFAPEYAIVGEGSTGYSETGVTDVAIAHRGRRGSTITARGSAAHASEPDAGVNAIYRAHDAISDVRGMNAPRTTVLGHDVRGHVSVTEIDGGSAWNVVPETCVVTVDERTVPGKRAPLARVENTPGVDVSVDQDLPPMACSDERFARFVLDVADEVQDSSPEHVVKPHATDAGRLAGAGTHCVVVGASEPGEAHTADESVSIESLDRCYEIYRSVAESWS